MLLAVASIACAQEKEITTLRQEIIEDTKNNVLPFWINHDIDPNGGFYGGLTYDGKPIKTHQKDVSLMPEFYGRSLQDTDYSVIKNTLNWLTVPNVISLIISLIRCMAEPIGK